MTYFIHSILYTTYGLNSSSGGMAGVMQAVFPLWVAILFPCINLFYYYDINLIFFKL